MQGGLEPLLTSTHTACHLQQQLSPVYGVLVLATAAVCACTDSSSLRQGSVGLRVFERVCYSLVVVVVGSASGYVLVSMERQSVTEVKFLDEMHALQ